MRKIMGFPLRSDRDLTYFVLQVFNSSDSAWFVLQSKFVDGAVRLFGFTIPISI